MSTKELEQRLELAARQLGGSVRKNGDGHFILRIGYPFALNPNDAHAVFSVSEAAAAGATPAGATGEPREEKPTGNPSVPQSYSVPSVSSVLSVSPIPTVSIELLSRPLSPRRRRMCIERLSELRGFFAAPAEQLSAPLKRFPAVKLWGFYNLLTTLSSFVISGTLVAFAAGIWLWLLGTQQILAVGDVPNRESLFFGEPNLTMRPLVPAVEVAAGDAVGGAVLLAVSAVVPLALVLCCILLILELLPRSMTSFVLILLLWGVYFVWFFSAWQCGALGVLVVVTLPAASLLAYRLGWETRG